MREFTPLHFPNPPDAQNKLPRDCTRCVRGVEAVHVGFIGSPFCNRNKALAHGMILRM